MGCLKHISSFMGEFCQNKTKLYMEGFFHLDWDNVQALSCLNYIRNMSPLMETNHLTVTCKSIAKSTAWMSIHLCLWYYSTYKNIFAEIKRFSWLSYGGFLQRKNQLKFTHFWFQNFRCWNKLLHRSYSNRYAQDLGLSW